MKMITMWITGIYLIVMAVFDRRRKEIPLLPGILCFPVLAGVQIINGKGWLFLCSGLVVGIILYLLSKATEGAIGEGDALVYLLTGIALGFFRNVELLLCSLVLASFVSGFLLVFRRVGKKYRIPFIPFTTVAYGVVILL